MKKRDYITEEEEELLKGYTSDSVKDLQKKINDTNSKKKKECKIFRMKGGTKL